MEEKLSTVCTGNSKRKKVNKINKKEVFGRRN